MGSHGHQGLPFGYDQNEIHGIGLPAYINQPPPPGRPLLSEQENDQMEDFFSSIATDGQGHMQDQSMMGPQFHSTTPLNPLSMPSAYVGFETFANEQRMDWQNPMQHNFQFGHPMNHMPMQTPTSPFAAANGHVLSPTNHMFHGPQQGNMQQFTNGWQQPYPQQTILQQRQDMQFGSDPHFMNTGYAGPPEPVDAGVSLIAYAMQPTSSASNTQPNSRPGSNTNTEPNSPATTKKRKLNSFQSEALRMTAGNGNTANGIGVHSPPPASARHPRKSFKQERPPTPISKTPTTYGDEEDADPEEDAEFDEDEIDDQPGSPLAPWPASKARPVHKPAAPPKPAKPRKKSVVDSPARAKPTRRQSTAPISNISRVPLTAEQKKANHTNSEQRRRDATSKAYAELYDLVPEIEEAGKQSTMKKMGIVVAKVQSVSNRLKYLRSALGRDPNTGKPVPRQISQHQYSGDMAHLSGWQ